MGTKKGKRTLLTDDELNSLVWLVHKSPHQLLGMHPLGDGSGVVARALIPDATAVEVRPVHEKDRPAFSLAKIHDVPDPYFEDNFDEVFEICRAGCAGLLEHIVRERGLSR